MQSWQRIFAYITGAIVFGLAIILVSRNFIQYVAREGTAGYLFLFGFALIFLNLNFGINRRFVLKMINTKWACYLMTILTIAPTIFWVYTKEVGLAGTKSLFVMTIIFSAFLGTYLGIRRGVAKREQYIRQAREEQEHELPDDLKRPHDDLSKN